MKKSGVWLVILLLLAASSVVWFRNVSPSSLAKFAQNQTVRQTDNSTTTDSKVEEPFNQPVSQNSLPAKPTKFVPILMYHYIRSYDNPADQLGIGLSVAPTTFDAQLAKLKSAGYKTVTLQEFFQGQYPAKAVVITFDDGYDDHYNQALPILKKYSDVATFFIVGGFVGKPGYMTSQQIIALKSAGMEIGGHTMTHINLATAPYLKAYQQISGSMIGRDPVFAYPAGKYASDTLNIVRSLHIEAAVTTNLGVATDVSDLLALPRLRIKNTTDVVGLIIKETALAKNGGNRPSSPSQTPGE